MTASTYFPVPRSFNKQLIRACFKQTKTVLRQAVAEQFSVSDHAISRIVTVYFVNMFLNGTINY